MKKPPQIKYFAEGPANAAARANAERRTGVWKCLARFGITNADTMRVLEQKRLVLHLALAAIAVQLLSLLAWSNTIAIIVYAIPTLLAAAGAVVWFGQMKDHTALRWLLFFSGYFYAIAFFGSESCRPLEESGGRVFAVVLPTVLFHVPAGGSLIATVVAASGHLFLYAIYAIVEASLDRACFDQAAPIVSGALGQMTLQLVIPFAVTIATCVAQFRLDAAGAAEREDVELFSEAVLAHLDNEDYAEANAIATSFVTERGFVPRASDLALQHALLKTDAFRRMVPNALVSAVSGRTPETKSLSPPKATAASSVASSSANLKVPAPTHTPPQPAAVVPPSPHQQQKSPAQGPSKDEHLTAPHRHSRAGFVAFTDDSGNDVAGGSVSPLVGPSGNPSRRNSGNPMPGSIDSPRGHESGVYDGSEPTTHGHSGLQSGESFVKTRRRSTQLARRQSMRQMFPMQRRRTFIAAFSLPRMTLYLEKPRSQPEMVRLILGQYREHLARVCSVFGGKILFTCFNDVVVTFDTCASATAAATRLLDIMEADNRHHIDPLVKETTPYQVMCIIVNTELVQGAVGNDPSNATTLGWSPAEAVFAKVKHHFALSLLSPPIVLIADTLVHLIADDFRVSPSEMGHFSIVEGPKAKDQEGLPLLRHSRAKEAEEDDDKTYELPDIDRMLDILGSGGGRPRGASMMAVVPSMGGPRGMTASMGESVEYHMDESMAASGEGSGEGDGKQEGKFPTKRRRVSPEVMQMWRRFDADGNGHLDSEEIREVLAELGIYMNEPELRDFFTEVDRDGSGTISLDEFTKAFFSSNLGGATVISSIRKAAATMKGQTGVDNMPVVISAWKRYDKDGSGTLEAEELAHVLSDLGITQSLEEVEWLVQKLDANGNGTVDFEEFASLFSEDVTEMKDNIVKQRIQTVARVMQNRANQEVFSNDDQLKREKLVLIKHVIDTWLTPILFLYIMYNFGQSLYRAAMGPDLDTSHTEIAIDMSLDIIYVVFFAMKVAFLPREVGGHVLHKRAEVLKEYVFSLEFACDLLVILPFDAIYLGIGDPAVSGAYGYYRLNKLACMYHFDERLTLTAQPLMSPVMYRIANALAWFVVTCHVFACSLLLLSREIGEARMLDMVGSSQIISKADTRYLLAILWSFQTLAGQLRGEALPPTDEQLVLMIFAVLVGLPIFAALLAVIGNAVTVQTTESMFLARVDSLRSYFSYAAKNMAEGEAAGLETECIQYYRHLYETTGSLDIQANPLQDVPMELLIQVTVETGLDMLRKVPIFQEACENVEFVHEITTKMMPRVIEPGMVVMRKGERGSNMYLITYGDFNVVVENVGVVFTLRKGNFFGEIALLHNVKRTATIVCDSRRYANVLTLEKRDFDEVLQLFPQCLSAISKAAGDRLKQSLDAEAEEQRKLREQRAAERAEEERIKKLQESMNVPEEQEPQAVPVENEAGADAPPANNTVESVSQSPSSPPLKSTNGGGDGDEAGHGALDDA